MKPVILLIFIITFVSYSQVEQAHRHNSGIFLSAGKNTGEHGHLGFAGGLDHEFRLPGTKPNFGIGFMAEILTGEHVETLIAISFYFHPDNYLSFFIVPVCVFLTEEVPVYNEQREKTGLWKKVIFML